MFTTPHLRHGAGHVPARRGAMKLALRQLPCPAPNRDVLAAIASRRLALRFGLTAPVAAVTAALAGLGPQETQR